MQTNIQLDLDKKIIDLMQQGKKPEILCTSAFARKYLVPLNDFKQGEYSQVYRPKEGLIAIYKHKVPIRHILDKNDTPYAIVIDRDEYITGDF